MSAPRAAAQLLRMPVPLGYSFRPLIRGRGRRSAPIPTIRANRFVPLKRWTNEPSFHKPFSTRRFEAELRCTHTRSERGEDEGKGRFRLHTYGLVRRWPQTTCEILRRASLRCCLAPRMEIEIVFP